MVTCKRNIKYMHAESTRWSKRKIIAICISKSNKQNSKKKSNLSGQIHEHWSREVVIFYYPNGLVSKQKGWVVMSISISTWQRTHIDSDSDTNKYEWIEWVNRMYYEWNDLKNARVLDFSCWQWYQYYISYVEIKLISNNNAR